MTNESTYFSSQLSKLLVAFGKSQKDLSIDTIISESKLSKLLSGKVQPQYKDILKISNAMKVSPSFFFNIDDDSFPAEIAYMLGNRVYSILYSNAKQDTLILMGHTVENSSFIPIKSLEFLSQLKYQTIFSITLVFGKITVGSKKLTKGNPVILNPDDEMIFTRGSSYVLQIIGDVSVFTNLMKSHLSPDKTIKF